MEVNNGGFNKFFFNSTGAFAQETVASLKAIGATKTAAIVQEAIDRWPTGHVPKSVGKRHDLEAKINPQSDLFEDLDKRFYKYAEDLDKLNMDYVRANRDEF